MQHVIENKRVVYTDKTFINLLRLPRISNSRFRYVIIPMLLQNLYSSPDIIRQIKSRRMRWARHVARMGEERKLYKVLVGKPEGKRPFG
jgi:hypothetical protein